MTLLSYEITLATVLSYLCLFSVIIVLCDEEGVGRLVEDMKTLDHVLLLENLTREYYVPTGGLVVDLQDERRLLIALDAIQDFSRYAVIGTAPLAPFLDDSYGQTPIFTPLYGVHHFNTDHNSQSIVFLDGSGAEASIVFAQHLTQLKTGGHDIMYFVDNKSCVRRVHRSSGRVDTPFGGSCHADGMSWNLDPTRRELRGIAADETNPDKVILYISVQYFGLYRLDTSEGNPWPVLIMSYGPLMVQNLDVFLNQLISGPDDWIHYKVTKGIYRFDPTVPFNESNPEGTLEVGVSYIPFISTEFRGYYDKRAVYHNTDSLYEIGFSTAGLTFSPENTVLLITDVALRTLFLLDLENGTLDRVCAQKSYSLGDGPAENCTLNYPQTSVWLDSYWVLTADYYVPQKRVAFRRFRYEVFKESKSLGTTTTTQGSLTAGEKAAIVLGCLPFVIIIIAILSILYVIRVKNSKRTCSAPSRANV